MTNDTRLTLNNSLQGHTQNSVMTEILKGERKGKFRADNLADAAAKIRERIKDNGGAKKLLNTEKVYKGVGSLITSGMSVGEQLKSAGLDWGVASSAIRYGDMFQYADTKGQAIYREDNGALLTTTLSDRWRPFQNSDIIGSFNEFCNDAGIEIERIGSLRDGKLIFASAIVNESWDILNTGDTLAARIILTNSHEWGKGVTCRLNAIRLVCCNGMTSTVKIGQATISHRLAQAVAQEVMQLENVSTSDVREAQDLLSVPTITSKVREILEMSKNSFAEYAAVAEHLAGVPINNSEARDLLVTSSALRGDKNKPIEEQSKVIQEAYQHFTAGTATGGRLESANGTAWGLVNAVTEFVNHNSATRGGVESHINSLWYGTKASQQNNFVSHVMSSIDFANARAAQKHLQREAQTVRAF